jgi:hypothetical protein
LSKPFRSDKRKKELQRLKKQEEKRLRRFGLKQEGNGTAEGEATESEVPETENEVTEAGSDDSGVARLSDTSSKGTQPEAKQVAE